jgi:stress-induced morphogen
MGRAEALMTARAKVPGWHAKRTHETRKIEEELRKRFPHSDAYRFNSASIRVRIIDDAFEGMSEIEREQMVDPILEQLPDETQADIMLLLTLTKKEATARFGKHSLVNLEFENPSESAL